MIKILSRFFCKKKEVKEEIFKPTRACRKYLGKSACTRIHLNTNDRPKISRDMHNALYVIGRNHKFRWIRGI